MDIWKALKKQKAKKQEHGAVVGVRFERNWKVCEDVCSDFFLRGMETNEGPEAQDKGRALRVQVNKDINTQKDRFFQGYCRNPGREGWMPTSGGVGLEDESKE